MGALAGALLVLLALGGATAGRGARSARAPVVLVSFDGFRWDYAERTETPSLDRLAAAGVRAERLIPVFPSKTYPGHWSIATGLYPGHHGILSNNLRDPRWPEVFRLSARGEVENGRWWGGEPVWATARRHGLRSGVYFWPGSEGPIGGVSPEWWFRYDGAVAWEARVDAALAWLTLPEGERASFVALYFEEPNDAGHAHGPDAGETLAAVRRADAILGRLLDGLAARGVAANVVVVSDHGMTRTDPARTIVLDDHVALRPGELLEFGAVGQIYPETGREAALFAALAGAHPELAVYRRGEVPARLHLFDHPRVAPLLLVPSPGWQVVPRQLADGGAPHVAAGDHGYDPSLSDMHGILYAAGPGLARGRELGAVEQVDVYALLCRLLGVEPAANDGVFERVAEAVALPPAGEGAEASGQLLGTWRGTSLCTDRVAAPACRDETLVYEFTPGAEPGAVHWVADKILDGERQGMGELELAWDDGERCWRTELASPRARSVGCVTVTGEQLTGTARLLPCERTIRGIDARREAAARRAGLAVGARSGEDAPREGETR